MPEAMFKVLRQTNWVGQSSPDSNYMVLHQWESLNQMVFLKNTINDILGWPELSEPG